MDPANSNLKGTIVTDNALETHYLLLFKGTGAVKFILIDLYLNHWALVIKSFQCFSSKKDFYILKFRVSNSLLTFHRNHRLQIRMVICESFNSKILY